MSNGTMVFRRQPSSDVIARFLADLAAAQVQITANVHRRHVAELITLSREVRWTHGIYCIHSIYNKKAILVDICTQLFIQCHPVKSESYSKLFCHILRSFVRSVTFLFTASDTRTGHVCVSGVTT
jgi:hypothetical protein